MHSFSIGFSPCPNDTFMFDALVNGKIQDTEISFEPFLADVEQLNSLAMEGTLPITKISVSAYASVADTYEILEAGSALGKGCGPLLISKKKYSLADTGSLRIAIPGIHTTANLLLSIFAPGAKNKTPMIFSAIEDAVLSGEFDAGLIIHENRFTYQQKGLQKIADMGELWEEKMHVSIPLGCIVVKRELDPSLKQKINTLIRRSIEFAFSNPSSSSAYVKKHSQELADDVIEQHIALYVNNFSIALGAEGKKAIELLLEKGNHAGLLPAINRDIFIPAP